jgi:hypothetical protein
VAELTIDQNPSITDTVIFELQTPATDGTLNPPNFDKVENITIFYVERGFKGNAKQIDESIYDPAKLQTLQQAEQEYVIAEQAYNADPSPANLTKFENAQQELQNAQRDYEGSALNNTFYYEQAQPVHILGTATNPAWDSASPDSSLLVKVDKDDDGRPVPLFFRYLWKPEKVREGDYFICWTWIPSSLAPTDKTSANLRFWLNGNTQVTTAIPSHFTNPDKYPTLLERYTPELFKMSLSDDDRSPDVIDKFNQSVALGFQNLEDLANQIVDLLDANAIHESLIPYLSNIFGLKLKSVDPTKWRAQIKRAVPVFKAKGTRSALNEAFSNSAMELLDLTIPWQIVSSYTWQESFTINVSDNFSWTSQYAPISIEKAWLRRKVDNYVWQELSLGFVTFNTVDKQLILSYVAIDFTYGEDEIRFLYRFDTPPDEELEDYLLSLPLMDNRDDHLVKYPYQNWNVRLIEESDPFFDSLIPQKQPFHTPIVYGKIRTEFPYSENVYNMEEYNGSNRDSKVPCDIDRFFRDECSACRSSSYNVEIEIENLSDDRVYEAKDILKEFMPFHAVLNSMSFRGAVNDFTQSPIETISLSISHDSEENVVHNQSQFWFNRVTGEFLRDELAIFDSFNPIYDIESISVSGLSTTEITITNLLISDEAQEDAGGDITSNFTLNNGDIVSESPTGTIYDGITAVATFTVDSLGDLVLTGMPVTPNIVSGTLNYSTGEVSLTWDSDPGPNSIEISYELNHNLSNGDYVFIDGTDSDNIIDGFWEISGVDADSFLINSTTVTVAGTTGTVTKADYENISATGYNDDVMVFCPTTRLDTIGMMPDSSARMQIIAPGGLSGFYTVKDPIGKTMVVELDSGVPTPQSEPIVDPMTFFENDGGDIILNEDTFVFNLFNIVADGEGLCSVNQDNVVMFGDPNNDFRLLSIQTNKNSVTPWKISFSSTDFLVEDFLPDGRIVLGEGSPVNTLQSLISGGSITYGIKDENGDPVSWVNISGTTVSSSNTGELEVYLRGRVTPGAPTEMYPGIGTMLETIDSASYYFFINTTEYRITGLKQDSVNIFYIDEYNEGDLGSSVNLRINKRILTNEIGYFSYQGMKIHVDGDLETDLEIQNGANSLVPENERVENNRFKENFLVFVDGIPYFVTEIDGNNIDYPGKTIINLSGLRKYWKTVDGGGTAINFSIRNYEKQDIVPKPVFSSLPYVMFEDVDRAGESIYEEVTLLEGLSTMSTMSDDSGPMDFVQQTEKVSFKIEYKKDETN